MAVSFGGKYGSMKLPGVSSPYNFDAKYGTTQGNGRGFFANLGLDLGSAVSAPVYDDGPMRAARGLGRGAEINTAQVDGSASGMDLLRGLTGAVLTNMGARGDAPGGQVATPVAYVPEAQGGGIDAKTLALLAVGAVAVGVIIYAAS